MPSKKSGAVALTTSQAPGPSRQLRKHVATIHTSGVLSLLERKMANVLLLNAYETLLTQRTHRIPVKLLCASLGWDESNNIERLQDALRKLASTSIEFNMMEDGKESWQVMAMISFGRIKDGVCVYRYDEYLAERLYDPEIYATINMAVQRKFESGYALTLYENCLRYKNVGSTGWWDLERFRRIMGANSTMYDEFKYLKRDVITGPLEHVNKVSDIRLIPEYQKNGRKVSAIRFLVSESEQQSLLKPAVTDEYEELRNSETYARLREHGIGERLAMAWILQDEARAHAVLNYVEAKDKKKQVKGSTAGYIRKLIEDDADIGTTTYEAKRKEAEQSVAQEQVFAEEERRREELREAFTRSQVTAAIKALTLDEKRRYGLIYIDDVGEALATTWNAEKADFSKPAERVRFTTWLRQKVTPAFDETAFRAWLQAKRAAKAGE